MEPHSDAQGDGDLNEAGKYGCGILLEYRSNHQSENRQDNGQCHEKHDQEQNPDPFVENLSGNITDRLALASHGDNQRTEIVDCPDEDRSE